MARRIRGWLAALMMFSSLTGSAAAGEYGAVFGYYGVPLTGVAKQADEAMEQGDYQRAHDLLQPEANAGNADAQTMLGIMYANGDGVEPSPFVVQALICAAAGQGHPVARDIAKDVDCQ